MVGKDLSGLSDEALLASLQSVCANERGLLTRMILHLVEVEDRRLHLEGAFTSMFDFCTRHLGLSEGAAFRRLNAARLVRRFPSSIDSLERGDRIWRRCCWFAIISTARTPARMRWS